MTPIISEQRDGMPVEVATAMLTEPRAKLSNQMRKTCEAARERVYISSSPIVWHDGTLCYSEKAPIDLETKTKRRYAGASLRQLGSWLRRSTKRRRLVQRAYLAVEGDSALAEAKREALSIVAERLDLIRDACEDEIARRGNL